MQQHGSALPALDDLLGSGRALEAGPPGIVIADFADISDSDYRWGLAIAELLRAALADLPGRALTQPAMSWEQLDFDCWHAGYQREQRLRDFAQLQRLGQRYGLRQGLLGEVAVDGDWLTVNLTALDLISRQELQRHSFTVSDPEQLSAALAQTIAWLAALLAQPLSELEQERLAATLPAAALMDFAALISALYADRFEEAQTLAESLHGSGLIAAEVHYYRLHEIGQRPQQIDQHYHWIEQHCGNHIELLSACADQHEAHDSEAMQQAIANRLHQLLRQQPDHAALARLCFIQSYRAGEIAASVRLVLAYVQTYPGHYLGWQWCAELLHELGWEYRGGEYWQQIEEDDQIVFAGLLDLAIQAADIALQQHPDSPWAINERMRLENGCTQTLWDLFNRGSQLAPHYEILYENALNFCMPRWGGNPSLQFEIIARAIDANPGQRWPYQLFNEFLLSDSHYPMTQRLRFLFHRWFSPGWPRCMLEDGE